MELTTGYRSAPGSCMVCASCDSSRPVVDLCVPDRGVLNRFHRSYLCEHCAAQVGVYAASMQGKILLPIGKVEKLGETVGKLELAVAAATARADKAEGLLRELAAFA